MTLVRSPAFTGFLACIPQVCRAGSKAQSPGPAVALAVGSLALQSRTEILRPPRRLPPSFAVKSRWQPLQGAGLVTVLRTDDFGCWEASVASTLGHHRSERLEPVGPFEAHFRMGRLGGFTVLHLQGRGRLRLIREQCERSVLWLPLRGICEERINGHLWQAEPGSGLLFHPGDALEGQTSEQLEGLSILVPPSLHRPPSRPCSPLLAAGPLHQRILARARALAAAVASRPAGAAHAADQLAESLRQWTDNQEQPPRRERITALRRRDTVASAQQWMRARLADRFTVLDVSRAMEVSTRQLQYSFLEEIGRSPMAEAKRLRLQQLRLLLLDREQAQASVAELMAAAGLIASGVTSADYRNCWGESPRQTRQRSRGANWEEAVHPVVSEA
jgi:AraC-like DNA-binding protein